MITAGVDQAWLAAIAGWLPSQRWFAGKQHSIASVAADAAVPITLGGTRVGDVVTLVVLRVTFTGGGEQCYVLPVAPVSVPGDLWQLGAHRLICGDSTAADVVGQLLGDIRPLLMVTDPLLISTQN